jgi:hypothetical protein
LFGGLNRIFGKFEIIFAPIFQSEGAAKSFTPQKMGV